jgi:hypothetical protein
MLPLLLAIALQVNAPNDSPVPTFEQFRIAQIYCGNPAKPIFRTKEELEFRTRIREGAAKGPNFAGHYAVVQWGGGTGSFVLVNVKTGQIFFHAQPPGTGPDFLYNLDSRVMVSNRYTGCQTQRLPFDLLGMDRERNEIYYKDDEPEGSARRL